MTLIRHWFTKPAETQEFHEHLLQRLLATAQRKPTTEIERQVVKILVDDGEDADAQKFNTFAEVCKDDERDDFITERLGRSGPEERKSVTPAMFKTLRPTPHGPRDSGLYWQVDTRTFHGEYPKQHVREGMGAVQRCPGKARRLVITLV